VKIWDNDVAVDDELASTTTDDRGNYTATVAGGALDGDADVYVQVLAHSEVAKIAPTKGAGAYEVRSDTLANLTSGATLDVLAPNSQNFGHIFLGS
jgi:hypothetical protein